MEDINCQIAEGIIPVGLCYKEQGTSACAGCKAATRRCQECKRAGNMGESKEGVCKDCLRKLKSKAGDSHPHLLGGNVADALELRLDELMDIGVSQLREPAVQDGMQEEPAERLCQQVYRSGLFA